MATNNRPTLKDVYDIVNRLEDKMDDRLKFIEGCVDKNTAFRYRILGVAGIIGATAGGVVSIIWGKLFDGK